MTTPRYISSSFCVMKDVKFRGMGLKEAAKNILFLLSLHQAFDNARYNIC